MVLKVGGMLGQIFLSIGTKQTYDVLCIGTYDSSLQLSADAAEDAQAAKLLQCACGDIK